MRVGRFGLVIVLNFSSALIGGLPASAQSGGDISQNQTGETATGSHQTGETPTEAKPKHIGGGVSVPILLHSVEPRFTEEARRDGAGGTVLVNMRVDEQGKTTHVRVLRGVGHGLDESAVEAVRQYTFKPAMENGKPVEVELNVQINFQLLKKDESDQGFTGDLGRASQAVRQDLHGGNSASTQSTSLSNDADAISASPGASQTGQAAASAKPNDGRDGIVMPTLVRAAEPQFSEQARLLHKGGKVLVNLWVDENGDPSRVRVLRGVGYGLDENAVAAVKLYKFKPATKNGKPVPLEINVVVPFTVY